MTPYRIHSAIDLMNMFFEHQRPFDSMMHQYFRTHKNIGSTDRRAIAEFCYALFRNYEKIRIFLDKITYAHGRFAVIIFLTLQKYDLSALFGTSCTHKYAPLSPFEQALAQNIAVYQFPDIPHITHNYPLWFEEECCWSGDEMHNNMSALNQQARVHLKINTLKTTVQDVYKILEDEKIEYRIYDSNAVIIENQRITQNHPLIKNGLVIIQDVGSQKIARYCDAKPGEVVIDFCAGAGGKSISLAMDMQNKGRIISMDVSEIRLLRAKERMIQTGVHNSYCTLIENKWIKRHTNFADLVLVDAPCSGSGTLKRNPELRAKLRQDDLVQIADKQLSILQQASKLSKSRLVYATCSIFRRENEDIIARFLQQNDDFVCEMQEQLSPYQDESDGFFIAKLRRNTT